MGIVLGVSFFAALIIMLAWIYRRRIHRAHFRIEKDLRQQLLSAEEEGKLLAFMLMNLNLIRKYRMHIYIH